MTYRTQKARGIAALTYEGVSHLSIFAVKKAKVWPHKEPTAEDFPGFARPCPTVPRHGFVDSRVVKTKKQFNEVCLEAQKADPDAEVILMPFIEAKWSGILTPAGLAVGPGNDGATAGHASVSIPASVTRDALRYAFSLPLESAGVKDAPFVEFVADTQGALQAVQIRDGPLVPLADRYVPAAMTVQHVVEAKGDLLEWEATAKKFKPGTVVWHPGGNMSSHYAIHCVTNKVPILCTAEKPKKGQELEPVKPVELTPADYRKLARYIIAYDSALRAKWNEVKGSDANTKTFFKRLCELSLGVFHAQAQWGNEEHLLALRALGVVATFRLAGMGCLGELRHWKGGPGRFGSVRKTYIDPRYDASSKENRHLIFEQAIGVPPLELTNLLRTAFVDFGTPGWYGQVGGPKWRACAGAALKMAFCLGNFVAVMRDSAFDWRWKELVDKWNYTINRAHNTGALLNKFADNHFFNEVHRVPAVGLTNPLLGEFLFTAKPKLPSEEERVQFGRTWLKAAKKSKSKEEQSMQDENPIQEPIIETPVEPVEVTAAETANPFADGAEFEAQFTIRTETEEEYDEATDEYAEGATTYTLHVQVKCPSVNRSYGWALDKEVNADTASELQTVPKTVTSWATGKPYAPAKAVVVGKALHLRGAGFDVVIWSDISIAL